MQLYFSRTKPFRNLQKRIGSSTYRLNTIFVGLDCVAKGQGDSGAIAVTWKKPSKDKSIDVANQAKIFVCTSALMLGADVVDAYIREIVAQKGLKFSDKSFEIATKATTGPSGSEYSFADRIAAICEDLSLDEGLRIAGLDLLASWRNVVAHSRPRKSNLRQETKELLLENSASIHQNYSHLDIELALKNFKNRKTPVGKEVTSLLAMTVNLCRAIDQAAVRRVTSTEDDMDRFVEQLLFEHFQTHDQRTIGSWHELSEAWQGSVDRRRGNLVKMLQRVAVVEVKPVDKSRARRNPVSSSVSEKYIDELLELDRIAFAERFGIPRK